MIGLAAACGGGGTGGGGESGGTYSYQLGEPENPFLPANTTESEGHKVLTALWTQLVTFDQDGNLTYDGVAESVTSDDNTTWTVTLKPDWTFHDGTPVTAESYVRAWNYGALSTNAQGASYFFENIQGYDDLQAPEDGQPAATEMSGLRATDDSTITVTLKEPFSIYPVTLGYTAFDPLPDAFFNDPTGFGRRPIGNGPFMAQEDWVPNQGFTVVRYDNYSGSEPAQADGVEFRVYTEPTTAYNDVQAGNLDLMKTLPPDALGTAEQTFGDRYLQEPRPSITSLAFPTYDQRYADPRVRQAISMGIDRGAIAESIFLGSRTAARSFVSPVVEGYREDACATTCDLNVEQANQLLDEAGFDRSQPIDLWFNAGGGHEEWMLALGNQLRTNLGVEFNLRGDLQFAQYLPLQDERGMTGPFRAGWIMDYPSMYSFLQPLYGTAALAPAGSNVTFYSSPAFDQAISDGNNAPDVDAATAEYQRAEDILITDMPATPLFYELDQMVWSPRISNIEYLVNGDIDLAAVTVD
ncbi:peptide ABC transporter substrate-binding protein [Millisia brevis]|uniref:peptide ABC transporter substrate-binding protein n=1 Tax=Millisia brevis TaxID=264148 RepID=UPI001FDF38FE|nr:ABC transporter substrate-binding protein [Millisia brevis]